MGRLLLDPLASSSSSFIISSFLIQMLRWIRDSSRVEFFIFLIAWGIFFGWWELDIQLLPFLLLLFEVSFFLCVLFLESAESNHFLLAHIPRMNESHDPLMSFKVDISSSAFSTSSSTATSCSLIWETLVNYDCMVSSSHSSTVFSKSYSDLCSSL